MPITVVTHRDDVGAPTNREVYAAGDSWRRGASGLEILSTQRRLIATYPDGNWLSVYVDNSVRVHTEGRPEEEPVPRLAGGVASTQPATAATRASTSDEAVLVPDEILAPDYAAPEDVSEFAGTDPVHTAPAAAEAEPTAAARKAPEADEPAAAGGDTETDQPKSRNLPPGMRPVAFRPRLVRPARRPEEPSRPSNMRPLVFRARTYRKPDE